MHAKLSQAIALIGLFFFSGSLHSQETGERSETNSQSALEEVDGEIAEEGTYQIIVEDERVRVELSEALLREVSERREEDKIVFIEVNDYARIKVLPYDLIDSENFSPLEKYRYEAN